MAQRLELRNQADVMKTADLSQSLRPSTRDELRTLAQLRMRLEIEAVVDFQDDEVNALLGQRRDVLAQLDQQQI